MKAVVLTLKALCIFKGTMLEEMFFYCSETNSRSCWPHCPPSAPQRPTVNPRWGLLEQRQRTGTTVKACMCCRQMSSNINIPWRQHSHKHTHTQTHRAGLCEDQACVRTSPLRSQCSQCSQCSPPVEPSVRDRGRGEWDGWGTCLVLAAHL